jgi:hypothetical protein
MVKVLGRRFYATSVFPLRIGDSDEAPKVEFLGYALVKGQPQFTYRVGDVEVRETITAPPRAQKELGLVRTFELDSGGKPVTFIAEDVPNASYASSAGQFEAAKVQNVAARMLKLPAGKLSFSVTITMKESQ